MGNKIVVDLVKNERSNVSSGKRGSTLELTGFSAANHDQQERHPSWPLIHINALIFLDVRSVFRYHSLFPSESNPLRSA